MWDKSSDIEYVDTTCQESINIGLRYLSISSVFA